MPELLLGHNRLSIVTHPHWNPQGHARAISIAHSTSQKALAEPTNPSEMSPTQRQHLVEYAARWGPIVADMRPGVYAERCIALARTAGILKLRVVSDMYQALASRVLAKHQY